MLTFGQASESIALDCGLMHKQISAAIIRGDEAESLLAIPPFTSSVSFCHLYGIIKTLKRKVGFFSTRGRLSTDAVQVQKSGFLQMASNKSRVKQRVATRK